MRFTILIVTTLSALNAKSQIVDRTLKESGSLVQTTKSNSRDTISHLTFHCPPSYNIRNPFVTVDGKGKAFEDISKLDPEAIANVTVLKGEEALRKFGRKAKYGAIIIEMKKS